MIKKKLTEKQLAKYIKDSMASGHGEKKIKAVLKKNGYDKDLLDKALAEAKEPAKKVITPPKPKTAEDNFPPAVVDDKVPLEKPPEPKKEGVVPEVEMEEHKIPTITKRKPWMVAILTIVTLGLYGIYWQISTTNDLRGLGAGAWHWIFMFVPGINLYYFWTYFKAIEDVTTFNKFLLIMLFIFFWPIGMAFAQNSLNNLN